MDRSPVLALGLLFAGIAPWSLASAQAGGALKVRQVAVTAACPKDMAFCAPGDSVIITKDPAIRSCPSPTTPEVTPIGTMTAGEVTVRFVIDSAGAAEPSSLTILKSSDRHFNDPASRVILKCRYNPAKAGTRAVRVVAEQTVGFMPAPK